MATDKDLNPFVKEALLKMNFTEKYMRLVEDYEDRRFAEIPPEEMPDDRFVLDLLKPYGLKPVWHNKYYCSVGDSKKGKYIFHLGLDYKWGHVAAAWSIGYKGGATGPGLLSLLVSEVTNNEKATSDPCFRNLSDAKEIIGREAELFLEFKETFLNAVGDMEYMKVEPMTLNPMNETPLAKAAIREMDALGTYRNFTRAFPKRRIKKEFTFADINRSEITERLKSMGFNVEKVMTDEFRTYFVSGPYAENEYTFYGVIDFWPPQHISDLHVWIYRGEDVIYSESLHYAAFKSVKHKDWVDFYYYSKEQIPQIAEKQAELFFIFKDAFMKAAAAKKR